MIDELMELDQRLRDDTWRYHQEIEGLAQGLDSGQSLDKINVAFWLRTFLRTFFAQVEGLSYAMRRVTLLAERLGFSSLSAGEIAVLSEKRHYSRGGKIAESETFNPTIENFLLAFKYFPKVMGANFEVAKDDHRWESFSGSLKLRNRLAHPKKPTDLDLTQALIEQFGEAVAWFAEQVTGCFSAILQRIESTGAKD